MGAPGGMHHTGSNFSTHKSMKEGSITSSKDGKKQPAGANNPGGKISLAVDTSPARSRTKGQGLESGQGKDVTLAPPLTVEAQGWALSREERQRILTVWDTVFMKVMVFHISLYPHIFIIQAQNLLIDMFVFIDIVVPFLYHYHNTSSMVITPPQHYHYHNYIISYHLFTTYSLMTVPRRRRIDGVGTRCYHLQNLSHCIRGPYRRYTR